MHINDKGLAIVKDREGCYLEAYPDPASPLAQICLDAGHSFYHGGYLKVEGWQRMSGAPWTIGYGHTGKDVFPGLEITQEKADDLLRKDMQYAEQGVALLVPPGCTENQFSACVSFAFNVGVAAFEGSTLLRKWREGDIEGAAKSFGMWRFAQGKVLNGLVKRRKLESSLFLTPDGAGWSVETANTVNEG